MVGCVSVPPVEPARRRRRPGRLVRCRLVDQAPASGGAGSTRGPPARDWPTLQAPREPAARARAGGRLA
eukprot:12448633-Alexandrium_andersonii.AAC.1